ncbi:MAG: hypothetical protein WCE75_15045 [Terracidiphilus sp.]
MRITYGLVLAVFVLQLPSARTQQGAAPLPEIHQLMREVVDHQKQLDKVRENYTFSSLATIEGVDSNGQVKKTETTEQENFFVNGHMINRAVKKDGKPLEGHEADKESERVTKLVEKAEKTPPDKPLEGPAFSVSRILDLMDVRNPRRENFRGRPTIVFDFQGRKDAHTEGVMEDASKKLKGTLWVDEQDRVVARLEVEFVDSFRVAGGLFASIGKGTYFHLDQAPVNGELWLPTNADGSFQARVLLVKSIRQRFKERDFDYERFRVETQTTRDAKVVGGK